MTTFEGGHVVVPNESGPRFNLVDEPWIPVAEEGGSVREVSLSEALVGAHRLRRLVPTPAAMVPAILRHVLLAVVLDVFGPPRSPAEWGERWRRGSFEEGPLIEYLDEHRSRFDLFDAEAPFAQVAGLRTAKDETKPAATLVPAVGSGNNVPLFSPFTEADRFALTPGSAARWLLHVHAWDTAAIKSGAADDPAVKGGKTTGNPVGPLGGLGVACPVGTTLFETLMMNIPVVEDGLVGGDRPHWRAPPVGAQWETRDPIGLLDRLTWLSRRVRLVPEDVDGQLAVTAVVITAGDRLRRAPAEPAEEPHTLWRVAKDPKPDEPPRRPRRHVSGAASWQGLDALLALPGHAGSGGGFQTCGLLAQIGDLQAEDEIALDYPLAVELAGYEYGNQSAVIENLVTDALPLPVAALQADSVTWELVTDVASEAADLVKAVDLLDANLRRACGGDPTPWDRGQRPSTVLVHELDAVVRRLLAGLQQDPDRTEEARAAWQQVARSLTLAHGDRLLDAVPPTAFVGRQEGNRVHRVATAERRFRIAVAAVAPRDDDATDLAGPAEEAG